MSSNCGCYPMAGAMSSHDCDYPRVVAENERLEKELAEARQATLYMQSGRDGAIGSMKRLAEQNNRLLDELAEFKAAVKSASGHDFGGFIRCVFCGLSFNHTPECIVRKV